MKQLPGIAFAALFMGLAAFAAVRQSRGADDIPVMAATEPAQASPTPTGPTAKAPAALPVGQSYENKDNGFRLDVPKGWTATELVVPPDRWMGEKREEPGPGKQWRAPKVYDDLDFYGNKDVDLTVNNRRPGLQIQVEGPSPYPDANLPVPGPMLSPAEIARQLQPGEIALEIVGRSPASPYPELDVKKMVIHPDSVAADLIQLLTTDPIKDPLSDLSQLSFHFFKRGKDWSVSAYLRAPASADDRRGLLSEIVKAIKPQVSEVSAEERRDLFSVLSSLRFVDTPVANPLWAESLALQKLPASIRNWTTPPGQDQDPYRGWLAFPARSESQDVMVTKVDMGYAVRFTLHETAGKDLRTWGYLVSSNGDVAPLPVPGTNPAVPGGLGRD